METPKSFMLLIFLLAGFLPSIMAQNDSKINQGIEIGLDFLKFNKDWVYYNDTYFPKDDKYYSFDFIPSIFLRVPLGKNSLRFKYEYFNDDYSFTTHSFDFYYENIEGRLLNNKVLFGLERNFIDSRFKAYGALDIGLSLFRYKGIFSYYNGYDLLVSPSVPFKVNGFGISIQPTIGMKYRISSNINIMIESSLSFEKGFEKNDLYNMFQKNKFIPRPISLFGLSYTFKKE